MPDEPAAPRDSVRRAMCACALVAVVVLLGLGALGGWRLRAMQEARRGTVDLEVIPFGKSPLDGRFVYVLRIRAIVGAQGGDWTEEGRQLRFRTRRGEVWSEVRPGAPIAASHDTQGGGPPRWTTRDDHRDVAEDDFGNRIEKVMGSGFSAGAFAPDGLGELEWSPALIVSDTPPDEVSVTGVVQDQLRGALPVEVRALVPPPVADGR